MKTCKHCILKSLPSMTPGFCRFHWAAQLHGKPGQILPDMLADYRQAIADQTAANMPKLSKVQ